MRRVSGADVEVDGMSQTKGPTQRLLGKAKQSVGEIIVDQDLHK